jgi:FixJ family two-component response regulator
MNGSVPLHWSPKSRGGLILGADVLISVIDDDDDARVAITSLVEALGFTTEAFPSAAEFLACHNMAHTRCLIADVQMPGMTGLELHRHLMQSGRAIPTILITAYPDDNIRDRALSEGVVCYLQKPVAHDEGLLRCIRVALDRAKPEQNSIFPSR